MTARRRRRAAVPIVVTGLLLCAGCGSSSRPATPTDVPEPAVAPPLTQKPAGTLVPVPGAPEGLAVDVPDGLLAVGVRAPNGVALLNVATGRLKTMVTLPGAPRHLQLAGPRGPVLAPAESVNQLFQVALPGGRVVADTPVGRQPHDAASTGGAGGTVFVGNEFSNTVSLIRGGKQVAVVPSPLQPGGVAAAPDGSVVVVVGVRGRRIEAYTPDGKSLGSAPVGVGPTHVRAGTGGLFYVADTEGNAVLVFRADAHGVRQVGRVATLSGRPYGIAVDVTHSVLYTTLTATNRLESFRITGDSLLPARTWPTARQPNDVAVDDATGRVFVAGTGSKQIELIDP